MDKSTQRSDNNKQDYKQESVNVPDLRFKEFKEEWIETTLGNVVKEFINGQTPSRKHPEFWEGNIPWVSSGELNYNIIETTNEMITEEGRKNANLHILPKGTLLIAITGLEAAGTRGSCAILGIKATTNQSCMALVPNTEKVTRDFLYNWYLKIGQEYGIKYTQGTKQQSYNIDILRKLPIKIPQSIEEQNKITELLTLIEQRIKFMEKKYIIMDELKKSLIKQLYPNINNLIPTIRFNNFDEKWNKIKIGELGKVTTGSTPKTKEKENYNKNGILWITPGDISSEKYIMDTERKLSLEGYKKGRSIQKNSIFVTCIGIIGKKCINLNDCSCNQQINAITPFVDFDTSFIYYAIDKYMHHFDVLAGQSVTPILNKKDFSKIEILTPNLNEQKSISSFLSNIDKKIDIIKKQIELNKEFRRSLLSKMFC